MSSLLTANLRPEVGLRNGAAGTVISILFADGHRPPSLPIAVIVKFKKYIGPFFLTDQPCSVPVPPITFDWCAGNAKHSRQQLPLKLRYAITIHKSQGKTLDKAVIDLGKREMAAGCTFVAASRVRSLEDCIVEPMSFQRLASISNNRNFQARLTEESCLQELAAQTKQCTHPSSMDCTSSMHTAS